MFPSLKTADNTLSTQTAILDDVLSGDREHFVQDQMRLFYFTDVPRLLYALNANVQRRDPENADQLQKDFADKRKALLDTEGDIAFANTQINLAAQELRSIQEDLRRTTAQLAKADTDAKGAEQRLESLTRLNDTLTLRQTNLQRRLDDLNKQAGTTNANDTARAQSLQNQINQTQQQMDRAKTQSDQQNIIVKQLTDEQAAIKKQHDTLLDQQTSLQDKQTAARKSLIDLQSAQAKARIVASRTADEEAQAFGDLHAHGAFYYTEPVGVSTDPIKRVILIGYDDSKVIFIRGLPKDVERVKELIAGYDRPAPQARVTLWTLQLNGSDINAINRALKNVENTLRDLRGSIISVQDILRDSITEEVNRVAQFALKPSNSNISTAAPAQEQARLARYFFYSREIRQVLGFPFLLNQTAGSHLRSHPLSPEFPVYTGKPPAAEDYAAIASLTRWTLPDPAHATTLGEMLFVLSLGKVSSRVNILNRFAQEINKRFEAKGGQDVPQFRALKNFATAISSYTRVRPSNFSQAASQPSDADIENNGLIINADYDLPENTIYLANPGRDNQATGHPANSSSGSGTDTSSVYPAFPRTILGLLVASPPDMGVSNSALNANQLEILSALQSKSREAVTSEIRRLLSQIDALEIRKDDLAGTPLSNKRYDSQEALLLREQYLPLVGWLYSKFFKSGDHKEDDGLSYYQLGLKATGVLHTNIPTIVGEIQAARTAAPNPQDKTDADKKATQEGYQATIKHHQNELREMDIAALNIVNVVRQRNSLAEATPRVAAADDMIKRMIIVAEDDLNYFFVQPALDELRKNARSNVQVGVLNRESMLVTNRQISRLDPRASANLNLSGGTDFLQEATQLGQIISGVQNNQQFRDAQRQEKLQTTVPLLGGGLAARLGQSTGNYFALGGLLALFGDLASKPQDAGGEIYSINTGSQFQITPIFDPSGQALRFDLNYTAATRIQSPLGTTTPDLPNIDRHTINTPVQISNLEFREISTFEANTKIGLPEVRSGGVPIVKDLPIFRDIPILGYFYRRKASAAARQESILFAQTSMYPTIGDIVDVLSDVPLRFDLNTETPDYLKPVPVPTEPKSATGGVLSALAFDPAPVVLGNTTVGTVTFSAPVSENTTVHLNSDDEDYAHLPMQTVVVPKGQTSAVFIIKTGQFAAPQAQQPSGAGGSTPGANSPPQSNTTPQPNTPAGNKPPQPSGASVKPTPVGGAKPPPVAKKSGSKTPFWYTGKKTIRREFAATATSR